METPEVQVCRAGPDDVAAIVQLSTVLFQEDAGQRDPSVNLDWPAEEGHEYFGGLVAGKGSVCLLAENTGEVIGYLAARVREGTSLRPVRVAELESMCVLGEHRGRGVGARLAEEFFVWAELQGAERASVTAYAENGRAVRFYERFGFRPRNVSLERRI